MNNMLENATRACRRRLAGIALVETTFALVILSVGILAVFALFSRGLERGAESEADMQVALFADNVLEGIRAAANQAAEEAAAEGNDPGKGWEEFWGGAIGWLSHVPVAASNVWLQKEEGALASPVILEGGLITNVYQQVSLRNTDVSNVVNHAFRYTLEQNGKNPVAVTLQVWPGRFGSTSAVPPKVFYTEYRKPDFF